ncbi:MAG: hypothetical protein HY438_01395 [DPANN group archaeon]|nr:hypothetical protein [DPANN group archaeon]
MTEISEFISIVTKSGFEPKHAEEGVIIYRKEWRPGLSARLTVSRSGWTLGPAIDLTKLLTGNPKRWPEWIGESVGDHSSESKEFNLDEFVAAYEKVLTFIGRVADYYKITKL